MSLKLSSRLFKIASGLRYASSAAVARLKVEKHLDSDLMDKDSDRFELQQFIENENFLNEKVFGKLEMPKSVEDEFGRIEDDELRQKQKEYEFMMLTPNLVKQPGIELDISQMETGEETTSRKINRFRRIIYDQGELLNSDLTKPPSNSNPHPFIPTEDIMPPTHSHSIAQYANFSQTVQMLVDMGVDLFESTQNDPRLGQALVRLDWERDVKPKIYWLHKSVGFSPDDLANYLSRNPYFLLQKQEHLNNRDIGLMIQLKGLMPVWIAFGIGQISGTVRSLNAQCGFSQKDLRLMLVADPRLFLCDIRRMLVSYNYLAYIMKIENEQIVLVPYGLRNRHEYLHRLKKANYIPKTPNCITLYKLLHPSDRYFSENVAETPLEDYNLYRPYVSRWARAWKALKAKPRHWMHNYTEIFFSCVICIPGTITALGFKVYKDGLPDDLPTLGFKRPPYYRQFYEVRRPDDRLVKSWRPPEDYPPDYHYHRAGVWPAHSWNDNAWDVK
uniref:Uncharacterized protein n=1 Tax=Meloidogyne javanica TaxID=6303 RepID=A0A915LIN9_MELJA